jgi:predicted SnoaL-like aldol condensation-catalyzing enzyme
MTQHATTATEPAARPRFTVAHWSAFWAKPDASLAARVAIPEVVGDWPGDPAPVRGKDAYRDRIAQVLERVPDLHLEVAESAEDGDVIFIHWVAHGTGANGPFQMDGIDRILLEDGLVKENVIRYDAATFDALVGDTEAPRRT